MERREKKRIVIGLKARISYKERNCEGVIENLSEDGMNVITMTVLESLEFQQGEALDLEFQPHTGETLKLSCTIKWAKKAAPHGTRTSLGLELMNPPWDESVFIL